MKRLLAGLAMCVVGRIAEAQILRGSVSDSTSRRPIPGAVLLLLDAGGNVLGRNITNEQGAYAVALTPAMQRVRIQRIGFRPRELPLPASSNQDVPLDVRMVAVPAFLEAVRVSAMACGTRPNQTQALALLEQARAGLLTTVVARAANPASLVLYMFERTMDGTTERINHQRVWTDSTYRRAVSFSAVRSAADFVRLGFMMDVANEQVFLAPDADVLLDDRFTAGYCFRVMPPNRRRANQIGLGFEAASRERGRIDIEGALWIDTAARALRDIEFRYVGLDQRIQSLEPGGTISFREMTNGVVLVDRWSLRLIGTSQDTLDRNPMRTRVEVRPYVAESGGELARATWRDGAEWRGSLGVLDLQVTKRNGTPWPGLVLRFPDSPYRATADSNGRLKIREIVPGPYSAVADDSLLALVDMRMPTDLWFMSQRDSLALALKVPTTDEYIVDRCVAERRMHPRGLDVPHVLVRVMRGDRSPVSGASVAMITGGSNESTTSWAVVRDGGRTGADGLIPICSAAFKYGQTIQLTVTHDQLGRTTVRRDLAQRANVILIFLGR
jgi:hypothetical protein